jgi:chromosome segregation ATPase
LENQLQQERDNVASLTRTLQQHQSRIEELDQERQFAVDSVARLEDKLQQRDHEAEEFSQRIIERDDETEQIREEMSNLKREHTHKVDEQIRALQEVSLREGEARVQMGGGGRGLAETDVEIRTSADKIQALKDEVERLRRQVHELQQESADKEVKIVQIAKQRAQDKEDMQGMNIALDSKQQELELVNSFAYHALTSLFTILLVI